MRNENLEENRQLQNNTGHSRCGAYRNNKLGRQAYIGTVSLSLAILKV